MATVIVTEDGRLLDKKGREIVDSDKLDELTKAFLEAWNSGKEE
jgi:hypothetical protein